MAGSNFTVGSKYHKEGLIVKVADASALAALTAKDGDVAVQLDTDVMYVYDGASWNAVGGSTASDIAYDATSWDDNLDAATKNAIRDKVETMDTAIGLNTAKVTNVSTNLSEGTATETTLDVNSSDGTNATLASASTSRAGVLTKAKWDEIVDNTTHSTGNGADHADVASNTTHRGLTNNPHVVTSDQVEMPELGTATYDDVQDWSNSTQSAGVISGGDISDGGGGTIDVSDIKGIFKTANTEISPNVFFDLSGLTGQALTDESTNFIAVDYNSGTPQFVIGATNTANGRTIFNLGKVFREGTTLDIIDSGLRIVDTFKRIQQHHVEEESLHFVSGAIVGETGTRNISVTAGVMYAGLNRITTDAVDTSGADVFEYYYYNGSAWIENDTSQIDNLQYNNIASGLATLSNNRYGVHWVYKGTNGDSYVLYGQDSYTLSGSQSAQPPASLPEHVDGFGVLRAKIIIKKSEAAFTEIEGVDDTNFTAQTASDHNELSSLQGGTASEYYHLTSAQSTIVGNTSGTNTGDQDISGKQDAVITTQGDVIVGDVSGDAARLALGANTYVLTSNGTTAAWAVGGGIEVSRLEKSANYSMTTTDINSYKYLEVTTGSSANITITLPEGDSSIVGKEFIITKIDTGTKFISVARSGSDTIRGSTTNIYAIQQYEKLCLMWNGSEYLLLGDPYRTTSIFVSNSGTPTISRQSSTWVSSLTDVGVGNVTVNFNTGVFLSAPYGTVSATSTSGSVTAEFGNAGSTSSISCRTKDVIAESDTDNNFMLVMTGPK